MNVTANGRSNATPKRARQRGPEILAIMAMPTVERCGQGGIVIVEEKDPSGLPVSHYRAIDTLGRMVRNGLIDADWAASGDRFRRDFHTAQFDPLCGMDLRRPRGAGGREMIVDRVEDARQRVFEAMSCLGGMSAPAGSVIWHVVGNETSLREWALRQIWGGGRSIRHDVATGILVAALGSLSGYYNRPRHERGALQQTRKRSMLVSK